MGIDDRDYMRDPKGRSRGSAQADVIDLNIIPALLGKLAVVFLALLICLRLPFVWFKLAAVIGVAWLGWRWISGGTRTKAKPLASSDTPGSTSEPDNARRQTQRSKIELCEAAVARATRPDQNVVRLLVAYDAAGEFGKAKTLIQGLDGEEFAEPVAEELAALAGNYFPIELEPTATGVRFKLA